MRTQRGSPSCFFVICRNTATKHPKDCAERAIVLGVPAALQWSRNFSQRREGAKEYTCCGQFSKDQAPEESGIFKLIKRAKRKPSRLFRHLSKYSYGVCERLRLTCIGFRSPGGVTAGVRRLALWRFRPMGKLKFTSIEPLTIVNAGRKIQPNAKLQALPARMLNTAG